MGKIVGFLCLVTILFSLVGCQKNDTHGVYEVTITANRIFNHSIGNDWEKVYTCDGRVIGNRKCWTVPLDTEKTVTIHATITELNGPI
ncbi:MAG: hypothetical protein IKM39_02680 [Clostridia bacterium]|nr:hypothetical protein [Clostridia bacterium]